MLSAASVTRSWKCLVNISQRLSRVTRRCERRPRLLGEVDTWPAELWTFKILPFQIVQGLTQRGLGLVNAEAGRERVVPSGRWREANVTGVITPVGRGGMRFPAAAAVFFPLLFSFQPRLLSARGIYWKGEVKMCELSLRSHSAL